MAFFFFCKWCVLSIRTFLVVEDIANWVDSDHISMAKCTVLEVIIVIMWWLLWNYGNDVLLIVSTPEGIC